MSAVDSITEKVQELVALGITQLEPYKHHLTPSNVSLGLTALLGFAGFSHALPGFPARMQSKQMGIPGWFIICAGLLMLASSVLYHFRPSEGLFAVSLCMGGAFATAAKMPSMMHRPGGMVFSSLTLAAALWVHFAKHGELTQQVCGICGLCFVAGIVGRIFAPTNSLLVKMLQSSAAATEEKAKGEKKEEKAKSDGKAAPKEEKAASGAAKTAAVTEAEKMPSKSESNAGGARKRVESPGPRAQPAGK